MSRPLIGRQLLAGMLLGVAAVTAAGLEAGEMFTDPALEARARAVGHQLRCMVCQNQSIFDSNAALARDLRGVVRERIRAGDDDVAVLAYVRERYGDYVLLDPPLRAATALLWAAPVLLLAAAFGAGALYFRGRAGPAGEHT